MSVRTIGHGVGRRVEVDGHVAGGQRRRSRRIDQLEGRRDVVAVGDLEGLDRSGWRGWWETLVEVRMPLIPGGTSASVHAGDAHGEVGGVDIADAQRAVDADIVRSAPCRPGRAARRAAPDRRSWCCNRRWAPDDRALERQGRPSRKPTVSAFSCWIVVRAGEDVAVGVDQFEDRIQRERGQLHGDADLGAGGALEAVDVDVVGLS